jgi:hypothetical protein
MDQGFISLLIILAAVIIFLAVTLIAVKLSQKGTDASGTLKTVESGLGYAQAIAAAISPFLPGVADTVIASVLNYAQQAVTHVETTYKAALSTGTNGNDNRASEAFSMIQSALALEGIKDTEQIDKLIQTVIPLLVLALPKTHDPAANTVPTAGTSNGTV